MNQKGIFITFMVFLLVASILALHDAVQKTDVAQERKNIGQAAFNNANNLFNNIYEEVVSLNKEGEAKKIQERTMPFTYSFEPNTLIISQRIPVKESLLEAYMDALNIYSIFSEEKATKGLIVDTTTLADTRWGGTETYPDLNYAILPQCLLYDLNSCCDDVNLMAFREIPAGEQGCAKGFDYSDLKIVDLNIFINSEGCDAASGIFGNLSGKAEAFDPGQTNPYLRILISEIGTSCPGPDCPVTGEADGKKLITAHFDPETFEPAAEIDSLTIRCGAQDWLRAKIGRQDEDDPYPIVIYNSLPSYPATVDANIVFNQQVELFYFTGFSISVEKGNFPVKRST